jgi:spore germination protein KC
MAGNHVEQLAATQPKLTGKSVFPRTLDFVKAYYADGKEPVAGVVTLEKNSEKPSGQNNSESGKNDDEKEYLFRYEGLAVFKDDKLVGYLDGEETRAYNFVVNDIKSPAISSPDAMTTARAFKSKAKIKTAFENNRAIVDIKLKVGLIILEENQDVHLNSPGESKRLAQQFAGQIEEEISRTIRKVQKLYQSDIFGFGVVMHAQNPEVWKAIKSYWNDFFADADIRVQVEANVALTGETQYPFAKVD